MDLEKPRLPVDESWDTKESMRRPSLTHCSSQTSQSSSCGEPTILIDDTTAIVEEEEEEISDRSSGCETTGMRLGQQSLDVESPTSYNPYLLSPWRDPRETRKHSLPTPQCAGITASQVRRLSDRGGPSTMEAAFLATLSTAPVPSPGGRRHSVVTISKMPPTIFGRNRRESIAAFPSMAPARVLGNRRESIAGTVVTGGPPNIGDHRGSIHNLQLDIMDDIVSARKVRLKCYNTSNEKICEVQPLDDGAGTSTSGSQKYTQPNRRYSEFVGPSLGQVPKDLERRRASANPGIVCTNTDLISLLSNNKPSCATPIDAQKTSPSKNVEQKRCRILKTNRSNSFDVSILIDQDENKDTSNPRQWFMKNHQPQNPNQPPKTPESKIIWDKTGSVIDAEKLGSAIEGFLRKSESNLSDNILQKSPQKINSGTSSGWYNTSKNNSNNFDNENDNMDSCDSTLCTTLKDLFIK